MQNKIILLILFITCVFNNSFAQSQKKSSPIVILSPHLKNNKDSIIEISPKANKELKSLIASNNLIKTNSNINNGKNLEILKADSVKRYQHVPLAGEASYFGEKNDFVNDFVRKYLELHTGTLSHVKNNSEEPFSLIDNALEEKKMPKELKYLAVIESALNHNAVSHAGAVGPWQLMEGTARMMGLTVNSSKDERTDWNRSTFAAIKYLDLLYSQMNDWLLVIAAYNSGPTPVQRAIDITGSHNFWDIKEYLPKETQGHVLAFIATATIFENLAKFINLGSIPLDFSFGKQKEEEQELAIAMIPKNNLATDPKKQRFTEEELNNMVVININQPLQLDLLAAEIDVDKKLLTRLNPDYDLFILKKYNAPSYGLHIPKDKLDVFLQKKSNITKKSKAYYEQNKY